MLTGLTVIFTEKGGFNCEKHNFMVKFLRLISETKKYDRFEKYKPWRTS